MTKIKANEGYELWKHIGGGKFHITKVNAEDYLCGSTVVATMVDTCNLDDLCGHCAKHRDAYTEIPEHIAAMPDGMRIMEVGEEITKECMLWEYGDGPWVKEGELLDTHVENYHVPHCCPIETQSYHSTCCTCGGTVGDAQDRIAELEEQAREHETREHESAFTIESLRKEIEKLEAELDQVTTAYEVLDSRLSEQEDLKKERDELKSKGEFLRSKVKYEVMYNELSIILHDHICTNMSHERQLEVLPEYLEELGKLRNATNGHTPENITTMMQYMRSPEELEGFKLRWGQPKKGESFLDYLKGQVIWSVASLDFDNPTACWLIRTPIVEYLHTEDVTNALIQSVNGQIECEFKEGSHSRWEDGKLLACLSEEFAPFAVLVDGRLATPLEVRIRKETIERLRIAAAE